MESKLKKNKHHIKYIVLISVFAVLLLIFGIGLNANLTSTYYDIFDSRIPSSFDGYRIAQLSDLHCEWFGDEQQKLINSVASGKPDIIVLTGDIIDAYEPNYDSVAALFNGLKDIAPVYAIQGNHEANKRVNQEMMSSLYNKHGIIYLYDSGITISQSGGSIYLHGLRDRDSERFISKAVENIAPINSNTYGILLYHRSDMFDYLCNLGYGLVLSGHMHGGLIRIPFIGGIVTPAGNIDFDQKYDGGMYTVNETTLISNKGLAPSHNIPRIFNRPEVVFITLHSKS